jgi:hypothetical protein
MHSDPNARPTQMGSLPLVTLHLEQGRSLSELAAWKSMSLRRSYRCLPATSQAVQPVWRIYGACDAPSGGRSIRSN